MQDAFLGDEQSDLFSLAACLFHAITGGLPFPPLGENPAEDYSLRWQSSQTAEPEFRHPTFRILRHVRSWLTKALAPDRDNRFKSFEEALEDFARIGYKRLRKGDEVYEFREWLGKDRIGEMFRAERLSDGRQLVIKRLFDDSYSPRLAREARILRGARHPNLVEYVDFIEVRLREDEQEHYLVLELLEGIPEASLRNFIQNPDSDLDPLVVLRLFLGYLSCLEHLHQRGILHRDIKPVNLFVLLEDPDKGKVFDLGIARDEDASRTNAQIVGPLDYMPPEFATQSSGACSPQSDLYSLGVALYQALTRRLPFPGLPEKESEAWLAFLHRAQNPPETSFEHAVFKAHSGLIPLLRQALAPDPKQRHTSAKAMRDALQAVVNGWHSSPNKSATDPTTAKSRIAPGHVDHAPVEQPVSRPVEMRPRAAEVVPAEPAAAQRLTQGQEAPQRKLVYDATLSAARTALRQENWDEAEKQANRTLELSPGDSVAAKLLNEIREARLKRKPLDKPTQDPRVKPVSPSRIPQPQPMRKPEEEVVAEWGGAKLVKCPDGKLELRGGSSEDQAAAREWISIYLQKATVKGLL
jgi:serine/threonine protein kinase